MSEPSSRLRNRFVTLTLHDPIRRDRQRAPRVLCEWALIFVPSLADVDQSQFLSTITGTVNRKTLP
jgi:hypothetical protein